VSPRFGTDGVRGVANTELTPELALLLGRAAARILAGQSYLVGRDTRRSGPMLQAALAAGLASEGRQVIDVGVIPTPGLAFLAAAQGFPAAMISASHNPFTDNGIKFLGAGGTKLDLAAEAAIEAAMGAMSPRSAVPATAALGADPASVGEIVGDKDGKQRYVDWLVSLVAGSRLPRGEVVVDCANGAASTVAPAVFSELGLRHSVISASPDGTNINKECGSTHLGPLAREVRQRGAIAGIAFDGDADRMLAVDGTGAVIDGDHLLAMFAKDLKKTGQLRYDTVVVTVLSNLGLRIALEEAAITVVETPVGDRHVADALEAGGYALGGEQSGHLIFSEHASTGDGLLTAIKLLQLMGKTERSLGELSHSSMRRLPQVLLNVQVREPSRLHDASAVWTAVEEISEQLGEAGRVLLRPSGTEPCVRVMVEAPTHELAERHARLIADLVTSVLG
jgi:phosphoglucosamine mutase